MAECIIESVVRRSPGRRCLRALYNFFKRPRFKIWWIYFHAHICMWRKGNNCDLISNKLSPSGWKVKSTQPKNHRFDCKQAQQYEIPLEYLLLIFTKIPSQEFWERESDDLTLFPPPCNAPWCKYLPTVNQQKQHQMEVEAGVGLSSSLASLPGGTMITLTPFPGSVTSTRRPGLRVTSSLSPSRTSG